MMLDLNDFKQINDNRGHEEGDRILRETGRLLADTFGVAHCYRYGGDEFLVICPDLSEQAFKEKLNGVMQSRPVIEDARRAGFSVGWVRATLEKSSRLRELIAAADERMYEVKRRKGSEAEALEVLHPEILDREYTVEELRAFIKDMEGRFDLARVVDPIEGRVLGFGDDGTISMNETCYGIWSAEQKCINCSSAMACRTGCHQRKTERFRDQDYFVQSNPVTLKLRDGTVYRAVVELVNVKQAGEGAANDREAENVGTRAASYLAHHDSLTHVLNADAFYELARERIRDNADSAWAMITGNIMNFRFINTLFGDLRGNEVLVCTAATLRRIAETAGGLCGRLGGDQFALLIPRAFYSEGALTSAASELSGAFNSGIYTFCIHFGVYVIDDPSIPVSVMCGRANSALRTIREDLTRTVAYFDDEILKKLLLEQTVLGSFDEALREGQFQIYLQPLVGEGCRVMGAEALVRWHRPDGTVMMPGDFIETLEYAGLIQKLDVYVWELAVKRLSLWKGTEKGGLIISVNMSAKDFYSIDVYEVLTGLVERYGVDSRLLRLEITETALLADPEKSDAVLRRLRDRGFLVEIDDFGKGYSSLSLLRHIRADMLKIDMSLVREIDQQERSRVILRSVIDLAKALGMEVISEGVETEHQLNALTDMGCKHFQGYYFSRPITVEAFEAKVTEAMR